MTAAVALPENPARHDVLLDVEGESMRVGQLVREVWQHRGLIAVLARKDFFVRYRRAALGVVWAVGLPLIQATVVAVVFSRVVRFETGTNYAVFILSGITAWTYFNNTLTAASTAIVDGSSLSTRIYFPRAVLPLVTIITNLYSFAINLALLLIACLVFGVGLGPRALWLVPGIALLTLVTAAFSLTLSALHVYLRDVRYLVAAVLIAMFYLTPIIYPVRLAPGALKRVVEVNPLSGVIELFRLAVGGSDSIWPWCVLVTGVWVLVFGTLGVVLQARRNLVFVDLL